MITIGVCVLFSVRNKKVGDNICHPLRLYDFYGCYRLYVPSTS